MKKSITFSLLRFMLRSSNVAFFKFVKRDSILIIGLIILIQLFNNYLNLKLKRSSLFVKLCKEFIISFLFSIT